MLSFVFGCGFLTKFPWAAADYPVGHILISGEILATKRWWFATLWSTDNTLFCEDIVKRC